MAKLNLNSYSRNAMATEFANSIEGYSSTYSPSICLYRVDITDGVDFNTMSNIDLTTSYVNANWTINSKYNVKKLQLNNNGGKVELSSVHDVSSVNDIGNYENLGSLVWAIPGGRNVDSIVIGAYDVEVGYFRAHAAIKLDAGVVPPSSDVKTFLISDLSIEFKGDGA